MKPTLHSAPVRGQTNRFGGVGRVVLVVGVILVLAVIGLFSLLHRV
jgi:hypothetical protein